jgi:hypothetical protein
MRVLPLEFVLRTIWLAWRIFSFHSLLILFGTTFWSEPSTWLCTVPFGAITLYNTASHGVSPHFSPHFILKALYYKAMSGPSSVRELTSNRFLS